jgi:acyl-CoA thioesterase-1
VVEDGEVGDRDYGPEGAADSQRATSYADGALVSAARARGTGFVSTRQVFRGAGNGGDPTSLLAADGDHPNDRGHRAIALALDRYLPNG